MRKFKYNKSLKFNRKQALLSIICLSVFIGMVLGVLISKSISPEHYNELTTNINTYFSLLKDTNSVSRYAFLYNALKYIFIVVIIWLFGTIRFGGIFIFILMLLIGTSYGYTSTIFIMCYGYKGLFVSSILYLIQFIILIPTYIYLSYNSINHHFLNNNYKPNNTKHYLLFMVFAVISCICVSLIETYFIKEIITNIL